MLMLLLLLLLLLLCWWCWWWWWWWWWWCPIAILISWISYRGGTAYPSISNPTRWCMQRGCEGCHAHWTCRAPARPPFLQPALFCRRPHPLTCPPLPRSCPACPPAPSPSPPWTSAALPTPSPVLRRPPGAAVHGPPCYHRSAATTPSSSGAGHA